MTMKANAVTSLVNLAINSQPSDGPMLRDVLAAALFGIDQMSGTLDPVDAIKLKSLKTLDLLLQRGHYTVLPFDPYASMEHTH